MVERERPFDPEVPPERYAQAHHFAVNAAPPVSELIKQIDIVVDYDGDELSKTALRTGDYVFAWQIVGEGQMAFRGIEPGRGRLVIGVAGGEADEDAAAKVALAVAKDAYNTRTDPTWVAEVGDAEEPTVDKYVMSSENAADMTFEEFHDADLEKLFGTEELTAEQAAEALAELGEDDASVVFS